MEETTAASQFSFLSDCFNWLSQTNILGLSLLSWIIVALVLSIAAFVIRGNHGS